MKNQALRTYLSYIAIAVSAFLAFSYVTRSFRAITTQGVRRLDLKNSPKSLSDIVLIDSDGNKFHLSNLNRSITKKRYITLITFAYTKCRTVCSSSALDQGYLEKQIKENGWSDRIKLLTVSFDPDHDTPEVLKRYSQSLNADGSIWKFATVANKSDLKNLLKEFGIIVLPDGLGGYDHNAAIFLVNRQSKLAGAFDIGNPSAVLVESF